MGHIVEYMMTDNFSISLEAYHNTVSSQRIIKPI